MGQDGFQVTLLHEFLFSLWVHLLIELHFVVALGLGLLWRRRPAVSKILISQELPVWLNPYVDLGLHVDLNG